MNKPELHVGGMLRRHVKKYRFSQAALARDTGKSPQTIADSFKRASLQTDALLDISLALRHNFFAEIAALLPAEFPPHGDTAHKAEKEAFRKEIETLKIENATLQKALQLLAGKN